MAGGGRPWRGARVAAVAAAGVAAALLALGARTAAALEAGLEYDGAVLQTPFDPPRGGAGVAAATTSAVVRGEWLGRRRGGPATPLGARLPPLPPSLPPSLVR